MFSYVSPEQGVPKAHPLRAIRQLVDEILRELSRDFDRLYATVGPPERLLRAQLLQIFYSIRSERLLMEQRDYNSLFRWFVGLAMDEPIWVPTVFTKNRDRLLNQDLAREFLRRVVERATPNMSDEHFTVSGRSTTGESNGFRKVSDRAMRASAIISSSCAVGSVKS